ncbi:MAG: glucosyltransferase domain-containing protein [Muribaculaceae bacterium]|nr:glucosyltransferase domain-containing protein [Muribaculaceae bacterium]
MSLKIQKLSYREAIGWIFLGVGLIMLGNSIRLCFCSDIWYDELFTVGMYEHSYGELVHFTAKDVHPPLYYCITKFFTDLGKGILPAADSIVIAKMVSVMPYFLLLLYSLTWLRKRFGILAAGLFFFCTLSMPQMSAYTVEMRMYSFALFFVTAAFIHACEIGSGADAGTEKHYIALTLYGLAAAYTQYFACVAVIMVYGYLFLLFLVRYRKNRKQGKDTKAPQKALLRLLLCAVISILAYLPWLFILLSQIATVRENYWILPLTWRSLGGCVKFLLKPAFGNDTVNVILAVVFFGLYAGLLLVYGYRTFGKKKTNFFHALAGCMVLCGLVGFGFLASLIIRPIFVYRYMLPAMGCFWLCFIWCLCAFLESGRRRDFGIGCLILVLLLIVGIRDYGAFMDEEAYKAARMEETKTAMDKIEEEDIVLYNFDQLQAVAGYYMEQESYLWNGEQEPLIGEMFGKRGSVQSSEQIKDWLDAGKTVWFFGSFNSREEICAEWEKDGLKTKELGSYMLERYWFNIYSVNIT